MYICREKKKRKRERGENGGGGGGGEGGGGGGGGDLPYVLAIIRPDKDRDVTIAVLIAQVLVPAPFVL